MNTIYLLASSVEDDATLSEIAARVAADLPDCATAVHAAVGGMRDIEIVAPDATIAYELNGRYHPPQKWEGEWSR